MTYQELKTALKSFQAQGHAIPALNSKKEVLQNALTAILESITPEIIEIVEVAIEVGAGAIIEIITTPEPPETLPAIKSKESAPSPSALPVYVTTEHPALTEIREIAKGLEIALIWAIALVRIMIRVSTPHIKKALLAALRFTIYAIALLRYWLLPKAQLIAYTVGIWGLAIALKIIRSRGVEIA